MTNQSFDEDRNPLEDFAAEMSEGLESTPVTITETSVNAVKGGQVTLHQSTARSVEASALHLDESGAVFARAGTIDVDHGAIGVALANQLSLQDTTASVAAARELKADSLRTVIILTTRVDGDVKTVFTPVTALAAGFGFAAGLWAMRRLATVLDPIGRRRRNLRRETAEPTVREID
jgi:hypothetical protein